MKTVFGALVSLALLAPLVALAAPNELGPHKGVIRKLGDFYTEVVIGSNNEIRVFLLDESKKKTVKPTGGVVATLTMKDKTLATIRCPASGDFFLCAFEEMYPVRAAHSLTLETRRKGAKGHQALYPLVQKKR
ncbi:MAG: hypothetical protein KF681_00455 [Bdellovibrionaceae bacterium]|nr:hypothetical protein [Pseudobdellovibrionaceae bacterium]